MRVVALGRTHWLYDAIEAVAARGHEIVLIGTTVASPEYLRGEEDFRALGERFGCPVFVHAQLGDADVAALLDAARADVCISVNWPTLIPASARARFRHGVLNGHAGALPRYRGNACPNWAILAGESAVGITVHQMADELDAGPILVQESIPIDERSYIGDVYDEIARRFPRMFAAAVDGLASGAIVPRAQSDDPRDALRCHPRRPEDGHIDWSLPAEHIARLVRASAEPFAGAYTWYGSARLRIWRADTVSLSSPALGVPGQVTRIDRSTGTIGVCCGAGELLVSLVGRDDGDRVAAAQVVRSTRDRLGLDLEAEVAALHARIAHLESRLSREAD